MLHEESSKSQAFNCGEKRGLGPIRALIYQFGVYQSTDLPVLRGSSSTAESLPGWCYKVLKSWAGAGYFLWALPLFSELITACWTYSNTNPESCFSGQYQFGLPLEQGWLYFKGTEFVSVFQLKWQVKSVGHKIHMCVPSAMLTLAWSWPEG